VNNKIHSCVKILIFCGFYAKPAQGLGKSYGRSLINSVYLFIVIILNLLLSVSFMKLPIVLVPFFVLLMASPLMAQTDQAKADSLQARSDVQTWAEVRKAYFRATKDDSLFVSLNSDAPYEVSIYNRGELDSFMEPMFFNSRIGEVVGPLFIDNYAMIFKIAAYDSTYRIRASHIYVKPNGDSRKDTLQAMKKASQYLEKIKKGEDFTQLATKYGQDETAKQGGEIGWLWEGTMVPEFEAAMANAKKGDVFVVKSPIGAHVVKVTEDKVIEPRGRVRVIPVVKKL
jgi:peptidyl-prolyl cis-trans isomerase D